ncbi:MAG: NAD(P)H-hydrate dehydratase, partial [Chloroflexi bacterium]|nr:NAD(P)H-hydrate dehydratase [Chloroflexota bacterium]
VELLLGPHHALSDAEQALLRQLGVVVRGVDQPDQIETALRTTRVAVDALVGIGAKGALREPLASLAVRLNQVRRERWPALRVVAVDQPSGVDADTGAVPDDAVEADLTVTLGAVKQGLLQFPAAVHTGQLVVSEIGLPVDASSDIPFDVLDRQTAARLMPARPLDAHKYRFGRVLVLAGSDHYLGAPILCSTAAARSGAGLVTVGSSAAVRRAVVDYAPEITYTERDVEPTANAAASLAAVRAVLANTNALVLGPGLGRADATVDFVRELLLARASDAASSKAVIDADALYALARWPGWWQHLGAPTIVTPHSGELERLAGERPSGETPWAEALRLARTWGVVLVAKGPFTTIADPSGRAAVWPHANAALATGGTGDVLAGLIGGLLAQGLSPFDAARLGVVTHALAADAAIAQSSGRTLLAADLVPQLPRVLRDLTLTRPE